MVVVTAAVIADVAVEVGAAAPTPNIARDYLLFFFFFSTFVACFKIHVADTD